DRLVLVPRLRAWGRPRPYAVDQPRGDAAFEVACMCQTLDGLRSEPRLRPPTHLKIDVDGHELRVLHGARELLASGSLQHLLIEVQRGHVGEVFGLLAEAGFRHSKGRDVGGVGNYVFERW
ncbi:MAG: FkbM family methyltransferase, partial [Deltaproteobacteria bacterium]|nr:FkbM family methyltransferase [Deltaproteobacteria bacterium]